VYNALYGFVLHTFRSINRRVNPKFPVYRMHEETTEHVRRAVYVFIWLILPASIIYLLGLQLGFGENAWGSMLWGMAIYFYSNFLPDLPSINRRQKLEPGSNDLAWYKKYALLLFAPLLVWLLFSGIRLNWRTVETYHNFTSLAIYGVFLSTIGFFGFAGYPFIIRDLVKVLFFASTGIAGFLTHLKVDQIW
jgi:hypothetical protein